MNWIKSIQYYSLPWMTAFLIWFCFDSFILKKEIKGYDHLAQIDKLNTDLINVNIIELLEKIELVSKQYNIDIEQISHTDNSLVMQISSKYENLLPFINECENIDKRVHIDSLEFQSNAQNIEVKIECNVAQKINQYKKTDIENKIFKNPFIMQTMQNVDFKLLAVIDNIAYIGNVMIEAGQIYQGYKITKIEPNKVTLQKDRQIHTIKVFDE